MKVLFDTSVLVAACVVDLKNHETAFECFVQYTESPHKACWTVHSMAEVYATLTTLPLKRRIQPAEAHSLIGQTLISRLALLELPENFYNQAIDRVARLGLVSGVVYDALHLVAAESAGCERLVTYNLKHFQRLNPDGVVVTAP